MVAITIDVVGVILAGLLAGEELIVRWGVQPALAAMSDRAHVEARIALVKRLKVVVPMLMIPTVLAAILALILAAGEPGAAARWAGSVLLLAFVLFSFLGTVPINMKVNDWDPDDPPADWRDVVRRWERIDVFRSTSAILAFIFFAIGLGLSVA